MNSCWCANRFSWNAFLKIPFFGAIMIVNGETPFTLPFPPQFFLLWRRWGDLQATSAKRRDGLEKKQSHLRDIDDLCLLFAKKASAFNSWFENVEEDLTDPVRCHSIAEVQVCGGGGINVTRPSMRSWPCARSTHAALARVGYCSASQCWVLFCVTS